jgi:hypothetical protein
MTSQPRRLLIRGFVNVRHAKTGFNPEHLFCFHLPLTPTRYPDAKKVLFYPTASQAGIAPWEFAASRPDLLCRSEVSYGSAPVETRQKLEDRPGGGPRNNRRYR